ncbi:hypothetical protein PFISCL1PPCAC_21324, partial [Pristionchus fissidentatus]
IKNQRPTDSWNRPVAGSIKPLAAPAAAPVAAAAAYCRPHGFVGEPPKAPAATAAASFNGFNSGAGLKGGTNAATTFKGFGAGKPATRAAAAAPAARPSQQQTRPDDDKDYSPEAIESRSSQRVQYSDRRQQRKTRGIPESDCPCRRSFVPEQTRWHAQGIRAGEVCRERITSNEKADQTVKELNGTGLYGEKITVARSKYWFKRPAKKTINSAPRSITSLQESMTNLNMKNKWEENNENEDDDDEIDEGDIDSEECEE